MKKISLYILMLAFTIGGSKVQALEYDKPLSASVVISNSAGYRTSLMQAQPLKKIVRLMNIKLTPAQQQALVHYPLKSSDAPSTHDSSGLRRQADVGMGNVPVLDQGLHGSCVTFANTAAIDALLGKGDYISQLCSLELGSYLEEKGYLPSGWDGSLGPIVLNQIVSFGIVNKDTQQQKSCGGLREYPGANAATLGSAMSLDDFKQVSENINDKFYWTSLLNFYQRFQWDPSTSAQGDALLAQVKKILATKHFYKDTRLTFAVLLPIEHCSAGACANYHAAEDTWALTTEIISDYNPTLGGHEMIIIGYNDDAVAIDHEGGKHRGLLTLRNSWGSNAGDHGNYYMTYDFFRQFVMEVQEITVFKV
jgi:hypothetical protein